MNAMLHFPEQLAGEVKENKNPAFDEQTLDQLVGLLGKLGGLSEEELALEKKALMESGIGTQDLMSILGDNLIDQFGPRQIMNVPIQLLTDTAKIPTYAHSMDACADIYADEECAILPGETKLISTGLAFAIPEGWVVHIYPRSSIGVKTPLRLPNSVGVIDSQYRDEVKLIYTNTGSTPFYVHKGDRMAQMSLDQSPMARFFEVDDVKAFGDDRKGGFGSTGV